MPQAQGSELQQDLLGHRQAGARALCPRAKGGPADKTGRKKRLS